ncbi:MAG: NAD-dependent protein deacetylase [Myxococcota bacterium]
MSEEAIRRAAEMIFHSGGGVALTGAGISVPSGIPDFRSPGGVWEKYDIYEYGTIQAFLSNPQKVWKLFKEFDSLISAAKPNNAHIALAELEERGFIKGVITQNIDGLHHKAGSKMIVEFHGNCLRLHCVRCGFALGREEYPAEDDGLIPTCPECDQPLKPTVVLFGEQIPSDSISAALSLTDAANVFVVVGTSASVAPASLYPELAFNRGIPVIEINMEATHLTERVATISILGDAAEILPKLVGEISRFAAR